MCIRDSAERYGLSALHQLRGRVGRGRGDAFCILISDHVTDSVKKRLSFLCHTTDGFEIAKFDLETRGPGDFFGSRQHGLPSPVSYTHLDVYKRQALPDKVRVIKEK